MFEFLKRWLAPKPAPYRPMAIRRRRINPVYFLETKREEHLAGKVDSRITEIRCGNDVSSTQSQYPEHLSVQRPELQPDQWNAGRRKNI
ncbi:hypothetical protein D7B12_17920 [Salmonella enterica]|nr:hypothetical protein [Salmonella enterica]